MSHASRPEHTLDGMSLRERQRAAFATPGLQAKIGRAVDQFGVRRRAALGKLVDPDGLRAAARTMRAEVNARLPDVLERFADNVLAAGGNVCWATTGEQANQYVLDVAARIGARSVVKGKSMATEETGLNHALEAAGLHVVETDLGEWIIQLNGETPSHIIAPAMHHDRYDIARIFDEHAGAGGIDAVPETLNAFARARLRDEFLTADLGITGCNLAIAETGSILLVENEGNGRMSSTLPRVHIAVMGMERIVETWDQADLILNLLARSGTGQQLSVYTNVITGPRRVEDADGPDEFHVVILDNHRSDLLGTEFHEMLNCIRCGACLNECPVYRQTGGHSYGWVYSGPMGAVLIPLLAREHGPAADELANASTLCGACMDACPVSIPLQDLLLAQRRRNTTRADGAHRAGWKAWAAAWSHPRTYEASVRAGGLLAGRSPSLTARLPGARAWAAGRRLPTPAGESFRAAWRREQAGR